VGNKACISGLKCRPSGRKRGEHQPQVGSRSRTSVPIEVNVTTPPVVRRPPRRVVEHPCAAPTRTQALEAHLDPRPLTQEPRRNLLQLVARDARRRDRTRIAAPIWPGRGFRRGTEGGHEERGGNAP